MVLKVLMVMKVQRVLTVTLEMLVNLDQKDFKVHKGYKVLLEQLVQKARLSRETYLLATL